MSNFNNTIGQIIFSVDKGNINEKSLIPAFQNDDDFTENKEYFRGDTIELGFENEAERVSKEIYEDCMKQEVDSEYELLSNMVEKLFELDNFIGQSSDYGDYKSQIVETEFQYVVVISYID